MTFFLQARALTSVFIRHVLDSPILLWKWLLIDTSVWTEPMITDEQQAFHAWTVARSTTQDNLGFLLDTTHFFPEWKEERWGAAYFDALRPHDKEEGQYRKRAEKWCIACLWIGQAKHSQRISWWRSEFPWECSRTLGELLRAKRVCSFVNYLFT